MACASAEYGAANTDEAGDFASDTDSWDGAGQGGGESPGSGDDDDPGVPETEDDFLSLKPAQTDVYVFVANPTRGTVTRVNVETRDVKTTEVGNNPSAVVTMTDYSGAVVFNKDDDSISIIDAESLDVDTVDVRDNLNALVVSPDDMWAALWHDQRAVSADEPPPSGIVSFNEVSFVNLLTLKHYPQVVGFDPKTVAFTADGSLAVVVSDVSLALVDLTVDPPAVATVNVTDDLLDPPEAEEVVVAPDGSYAFVRQFGATDIAVVDLVALTVDRIPVGDNPTDLDLAPDGSEAVVISRGSKEVYRFLVDDPFAVPAVLDLPADEEFGQVVFDPTGRKAILFSTASLASRYGAWDLGSDFIEVRPLVKPIKSVSIGPTGDSMMVFHTLSNGDGADPLSPFYSEWAMTLIDLDDPSLRDNPVLLPNEPTGFADANNGEFGYFIMDSEPLLGVIHYPTLITSQVELRSNPVWVGVLPDLNPADNDEPPAWISQEHELGRMSFYDPDDDGVETITGFELNSEIED